MSEILANLRTEQEYYKHDNWKYERIKNVADYIESLENEIEKLKFMIEDGLGYEDLIQDAIRFL